MDEDTLALYVKYEKGIDKVVITEYEKQWSPADYENFLIIKYINKDISAEHKFIMVEQHITPELFYLEWEREYLRRFKLDKLKELINERLQNTVS